MAGICGWLVVVPPAPASAAEPRIVSIYDFIRNSDFRLPDSEAVLLDCTRHQIELLKRSGLPATWALQLIGGDGLKSVVKQVTTNAVICHVAGTDYRLQLAPRMGTCGLLDDGAIRMTANRAGKRVINLNARGTQH